MAISAKTSSSVSEWQQLESELSIKQPLILGSFLTLKVQTGPKKGHVCVWICSHYFLLTF